MKWSWKAFSLHLGAMLLLGLALAYPLSLAIDAMRGPGGADSTLQSVAIGGCVAPMMIAAISGWKGWSLKPLLVAGVLVSSLYAGNLGPGLLTFLFSGLTYFAMHKVRVIFSYYFPVEPPKIEDPDSRA